MDTRRVLQVAYLLGLVMLLTVSATPSITINSSATVRAGIDYVVVIVMENADLNQTYNCSNSDCSYISSVGHNNSIAQNYYSKWCLSLNNYLVLVGGSDFGYNKNCTYCDPTTCGALWPIQDENLVDRIETSGRTWKAYMGDYPGSGSGSHYSSGGCYLRTSGRYVSWHNPFPYFKGIESNPSRCSRIVRANTFNTTIGPEVEDILLNDLQSFSTASNLMWLTPNNCDNVHDLCYGRNKIEQGNRYLSQVVPKILQSPLFKTQRAALFITWDEGHICPTCSKQLSAIWAGPMIKTHYCNCTTTPYYSHASFPKTLETIWHLPSLGKLDMTAPAMTEFFI